MSAMLAVGLIKPNDSLWSAPYNVIVTKNDECKSAHTRCK